MSIPPKDDVDRAFEELFGFAIVVEDPKPAPPVGDVIEGGLADSVLRTVPTPPDPESGAESGTGTPLDAARVVREAVIAYKGKHRPVNSWKGVAAKVLGLKRLTTKRWENVLAEGVAHSLFQVDEDTLSYPHLVPLDLTARTDLPTRPPAVERKDWALPQGWNPPRHLPCGHMDLGRKTDEEHDAARAEGHCCWYAQHRKSSNRHWYAMQEPFLSEFKVPGKQRRDWDKTGFTGYCASKDGRYIGGRFNDCRYSYEDGGMETQVWHPFESWCSACQGKYLKRKCSSKVS